MAVFVSQNQQRRKRKNGWTGHLAKANIATSPALERRAKFKETKSKKCGKEGVLPVKDAYMVSRRIMSSPTRTMWQCFECGRLYIDGPDGDLHCFVPENDETEKRILRARNSK